MSLPNYLANIKSSGVYRFVWDKSLVPPADAETLRLVVGYSEKGPFNTPVYMRNPAEFITTFGNVSKRLERKGIYFHRMAIQALSAGPILALNLKPFKDEAVGNISFKPGEITRIIQNTDLKIKELYNINRFWTLDPENLSEKGSEYITISATDDKSSSCTVFIRRTDFNKLPSYDVDINSWFSNNSDEMPEYLEPIKHNKLNQYFIDVFVFKGKFTNELMSNGGVLSRYFKATSAGKGGEVSYVLNGDYKDPAFGENRDVLEALSQDSNSNFLHSYTGCTIPAFKNGNGDYVSIDLLFNSDHNEHKMLMKINDKMLDELQDPGKINDILGAVAKEYVPTSLAPIYIKGYEYTSVSKSEGGAALVDKILSVLTTERGIREALTNRVDVDYHYIVDTFDSYFAAGDGGSNSKSKLTLIAKEKSNAFAFINFPKMVLAGNVEKAKTKIATFIPGEPEGSSFCGIFTQLKFSDGTIKHVIPSAALVSNNFMEKYRSRQPYYIVAGPNYGVLTYSNLIGPDYNFSRADLDILEPLGVNAIIYVPRRGVFVNSNQTAKQKPITGLSKIHIRELVIFLQDEIENLLQSYQWELNTQPLRDTIKAKADSILETVKNNGGVYEYRNICDESNNTPDVIDNEMVVLNTEIEPARGAGKMVHELTIYRTGELSSKIV